MNIEELINFNPILARAMVEAEKKCNPAMREVFREIVAALIRTGAEPEKIYATIKTGRLLTKQNLKHLTKADLKEWADAGQEYNHLAAEQQSAHPQPEELPEKLKNTPENLQRVIVERLVEEREDLPAMGLALLARKEYKKLVALKKPITWSLVIRASVEDDEHNRLEVGTDLFVATPDKK
jgi:hypothetical protein